MATDNQYIITMSRRYRNNFIKWAKESRDAGDRSKMRSFLRNALGFSYHSRLAKRDLRRGLTLGLQHGTERDAQQRDAYFEAHRKLFMVM